MKIKILVLLIALFFLNNIAFSSEISSIEFSRYGNYDDIIIKTTGFIKPKLNYNEDKLRLEILFAGTSAKKKTILEKVDSPRIRTIVLENHGDGCRLILILSRYIKYDLANIFGQDRLILEITDDLKKPAPPSKKEAEKAPGEEKIISAPTLEVKAKREEKIEKAAFKKEIKKEEKLTAAKKEKKNEKIEMLMKPEKSRLSGKLIIIEPGHGGRDPGAIGSRGSFEKKLTMKLASKLAALLEKEGVRVILTREIDIETDYEKIVELANKNNADVFISIHYNSSESPKIFGVETYYYTDKSRRLAIMMHRALLLGTKRRDRGIRREMFYSIHHTTMPAVLIEPCYITNPYEERLARDPAYQFEVAQSIVRGLKEYFKRVK